MRCAPQGNQSSSKAPEALADRWKIEQDALARFVEEANRLDFDLDAAAVAKESKESKESKGDAKEAKDKGRRALRLIGGVDISFVGEEDGKDGGQQQEEACAALVVCSFPDLKIVYEQYEMVKLTYPYVPGFLAFREVRVVIRTPGTQCSVFHVTCGRLLRRFLRLCAFWMDCGAPSPS